MLRRAFVVGTRGSDLARAMAATVLDTLRAAQPARTFRLRVVKSVGDADRRSTLSVLGGDVRGVFSTALADALVDRSIDVAVHSLKDLPTQLPEALVLGAVPVRDDPRDVLCGGTLAALPSGARVGTGSPRRRAQLLRVRPDLEVVDVRGNVVPRLRQLRTSGALSAVVLAGAGVRRVGRADAIVEELDVSSHTPAAGQGAIALQARRGDDEVLDLLEQVDDRDLRAAVDAERRVLRELEGGCTAPVGVYAEGLGAMMSLQAQVTAVDGSDNICERRVGPSADPERLVQAVTTALQDAGAAALLGRL